MDENLHKIMHFLTFRENIVFIQRAPYQACIFKLVQNIQNSIYIIKTKEIAHETITVERRETNTDQATFPN